MLPWTPAIGLWSCLFSLPLVSVECNMYIIYIMYIRIYSMCMKSYNIRWIFLLFQFLKVICYPFQWSYINSQRISWHIHPYTCITTVMYEASKHYCNMSDTRAPRLGWYVELCPAAVFWVEIFVAQRVVLCSVGVFPHVRFAEGVLFHHGKSWITIWGRCCSLSQA